MTKRKKRAAFGDESAWGRDTLAEVERHIRSFKAVAAREGQEHSAPDERWFAKHIQDVREASRSGYTRKYARSIGHHFRRCGTAPLTDGKLVRAVLNAPDHLDPLTMDLDSGDLPFGLGRAQAFADDSYVSGTYRGYAKVALRWVKRCEDLQIDPLQPPAYECERWFEELGIAQEASTVSNARNALSHYFRKNGVADIARSQEVDRILEGIKRAKPPRPIDPTTPKDRRAILAGLEDEGAGVRDRVATLVTAFSPLGCEQLALINVEDCTVTDEGVEIRVADRLLPISIGTHVERDLDIVYWLRKLFEMLPPTGPVFRPLLERRMRFGDERMSPMGVLGVIARAARRVDASSKDISARLRKLFELETRGRESAVVLAHRASRKSIPGDTSELSRVKRLQVRRQRTSSRGVLR